MCIYIKTEERGRVVFSQKENIDFRRLANMRIEVSDVYHTLE